VICGLFTVCKVDVDNLWVDDMDVMDPASGFNEFSAFGIGNKEYPLRPEFVEYLTDAATLRKESQSWRNLTGGLAFADQEEEEDEVPPYPPTCNELYGVGRCKNHFTDDQLGRHKNCMKEINRLAKLSRDSEDLLAFVFADGVSHIALLSVFALLLDPKAHSFYKLYTSDGQVPAPGSVLRMADIIDGEDVPFIVEVDLAAMLVLTYGAWHVRQVSYTAIPGEPAADGRRPIVLRVDKVSLGTHDFQSLNCAELLLGIWTLWLCNLRTETKQHKAPGRTASSGWSCRVDSVWHTWLVLGMGNWFWAAIHDSTRQDLPDEAVLPGALCCLASVRRLHNHKVKIPSNNSAQLRD
jgi:hypothetical protein